MIINNFSIINNFNKNSIVGIVVKKLVTTLKYKIARTPILEKLTSCVIHLFACKT